MKVPHILLFYGSIFSLFLSTDQFSQKYDEKKIHYYRERAKQMFYHAYDSYIAYAYPYDELRPITCDGHDTWGRYSLSLIDALDTLVVLGNYSEFRRAVQLLHQTISFDQDINVSVFETNIRVIGGLLSAHLLSKKAGMAVHYGWPCEGPLLEIAEEIAKRLLPAFDTPTGMPYGTVNLLHGVPKGETPVTCTAGVGTFLVEFGTISRLTGNSTYEAIATRAMDAIWERRTKIGLIGNHINVKTGAWTAHDAGIGAGVDSYFEYLLKGGVLLQNLEYLNQLSEYEKIFDKYLRKDDWYVWVNMKSGGVTLPVFQSLEAFWPGLQSLKGEVEKSKKTLLNYFQVWEQYGATPEFFSLTKLLPQKGREGYPLRPVLFGILELIESTMYLYQATGDPQMLHIGATIIESIDSIAKTNCGYAVIHDVTSHKLANRMESFFLAETTKYLYLLFDTDNFVHNDVSQGTVINTARGQCIIDSGGYIFNTEAHLIDMAALECCTRPPDRQFSEVVDSIDIANVFNPAGNPGKRIRRSEGNHYEEINSPQFLDPELKDEDGTVVLNKRDTELLSTCTVEPFYSKLSLYGETIVSK